MSLPSASKLQLAMACTASHVLPKVRREFVAGEAGRWKHAFVAALAGGAEVDAALADVPPEFRDACEAVDASVVRGLRGISELSLVLNVETETVRTLGTDVQRSYGNVGPAEVAMSLDYAGLRDGLVTVVDLKTGRGFVPPPAQNWQLRANALALARFSRVDEAEAALAVAPEGQKARFEVARFDAFDLADTAEQLRALAKRLKGAAGAVSKGEVPHLTMGEHCRFCPAKTFCPAMASMAKRLAGEPEKLAADIMHELTTQSAAAAWGKLKAAKALLADVESTLYAVAAETPVDLGGGRWLGRRETRREQLDGAATFAQLEALHGREVAMAAVGLEASKASVGRALRPVYEAAKTAGLKPTLKALEAAVLEPLRATGGVTLRVSSSVQEYSAEPGDAAPLPRPGPPEPPPSEISEPPF